MSEIETPDSLIQGRITVLVPYEEIRNALLGICYGLVTRGRDRRGPSVSQETSAGLVNVGEGPMLSPGEAVVGEQLAMESIVDCLDCARAFLGVRGIAYSSLTDEEKRRVEAWRFRIKVEAHRLAEEGLVDDRPTSVTEDGAPAALGVSGLPDRFAFTWRGVEHVRKTVPGTRWASGPVTWDEGDQQTSDARNSARG